MSAVGINADQARMVAGRLRALEAAGYRLTEGQRWVLKCCERRVMLAETFAQPLECPKGAETPVPVREVA
jgi:hypothetical protein